MKPNSRSLVQLNEMIDVGTIPASEVVSLSPIYIDSETIEEWKIDLLQIVDLLRKMVLGGRLSQYISSQNQKLVEQAMTRSTRLPPIIRPDAILADGQLKLLEINVDSAIGGLYETEQVSAIALNNEADLSRPKSDSPMEAMKNYLVDLWTKNIASDCLNVAIISFEDISDYKKLVLAKTCDYLNEVSGINAAFVDYKSLDVEQYVRNESTNFHILYRYGSLLRPASVMSEMVSLIEQSEQSQTILISDNLDLGIEQKAPFAILSKDAQEGNSLSPAEKALVDKYIPWTRFVCDEKFNFKGRSYELDELLATQKNSLVLKRCNSHVGSHVFIGSELSEAKFNDKVNFARNDDFQWVFQENIISDKFDFNFFNAKTGLTTARQLGAVICPFVFGNHFGGCLVRVELEPDSRVLVVPNNSKTGLAALFGV